MVNLKLTHICVVHAIEITFLSQSVAVYLIKNSAGTKKHKWSMNSNGLGYLQMCDMVNYSLSESIWISYLHARLKLTNVDLRNLNESDSDNDEIQWDYLAPLFKWCVKYVLHYHMRRAFGTMWQTEVSNDNNDAIPPSIQFAKMHFRKGYYVAHLFCGELVSFTYTYIV